MDKNRQETINKNIADLRQIIKECQEDILDTQNKCTHPNTFEGNFSWKHGQRSPATICSDCGKVVSVYQHKHL